MQFARTPVRARFFDIVDRTQEKPSAVGHGVLPGRLIPYQYEQPHVNFLYMGCSSLSEKKGRSTDLFAAGSGRIDRITQNTIANFEL